MCSNISKNEKTNKLNDIKNKPIKYLLKQYHKKNSKIEITHSSELPGRMGIGSSSAFVVSLINVLNFYTKRKITIKKGFGNQKYKFRVKCFKRIWRF